MCGWHTPGGFGVLPHTRSVTQTWQPVRMTFGDYQFDIYLHGLDGVVPTIPMAYADWEARAQAAMPPSVCSYVAGGAGDERTQRVNVTAFERWGLVPRMFVGAKDRDLSVEMFGMTLPSPVFMAPIGVIGLCAQDGHGDLATARAAARTGVPMVASTASVDPMEQVAAEFGDTPGFFQLYTPTDRDLAASLVHRAEAAGYKGIVVTLDTWVPGWRPRDLTTSNFPFLRGHCLANYTSDPVFRASLQRAARRRPRRPPMGYPCCSTRGSAAAPTSSRRSPSAQPPSVSDGRTPTAWHSAGPTASFTCCDHSSPRPT